MRKRLTLAQQRVFDLLEDGRWYDPESVSFLGVYRLAYLCEKLYQQGYLRREVRQREAGNILTSHFVYQKISEYT